MTSYTATPQSGSTLKAEQLASLAADRREMFSITPIIHPVDGVGDPRSRTFWSATANALYIVRKDGEDLFGPTPSLAHKLAEGSDLIDHGRRGPIGCDADAIAGLKLWEAADLATCQDRPSAPVAYHAIGWLPENRTREAWRELTLEFLDREIVTNGMVADWAIHALAGNGGGWVKQPHLHAVLTHRFWRVGRRTGAPNPAWLAYPKSRNKLAMAWEIANRR